MSIFSSKKKESNEKDKGPSFTNPLSQIFSPNIGGNTNIVNDSEKMIKEWLSPENVKMKTNLSQNQINCICVLQSLADQFEIQPLKDLIFNFISYMISKNADSAKQLVNILQNKGLISDDQVALLEKFSK